MKNLISKLLFLGVLVSISLFANAQCTTFSDLDNKDEIEEAHVIYRQEVKAKNFEEAYEYWNKAYTAAPAADGKRASHYIDGRKILKAFYKKETDAAKKKELADRILKLYDEQIVCYKEEAFNLGRKAYDMFYELGSPYEDILKVLEKAVKVGGNKTEYIVMVPYGTVLTYLFQNKKIDVDKTRVAIDKLNEICDYNIANNAKYKDYYQQAKDAMNGELVKIENDVFDCQYFKDKFLPVYRENPNDVDNIKRIYAKLVKQGCDENDPDLTDLKASYKKIATEINAANLAEYEATHPDAAALRLYKEGNFKEAIKKYNEAISQESDNSKKAKHYFAIASIQFRKLNQLSSARTNARKAAKLDSGYGKPFMLIGDMYAKSSRNCGKTNFEHKLAIIAAIDKWNHAKAVDSTVASDANKKIANYRAHLPAKTDAFERGYTGGEKLTVPGWIGETVTLRFK